MGSLEILRIRGACNLRSGHELVRSDRQRTVPAWGLRLKRDEAPTSSSSGGTPCGRSMARCDWATMSCHGADWASDSELQRLRHLIRSSGVELIVQSGVSLRAERGRSAGQIDLRRSRSVSLLRLPLVAGDRILDIAMFGALDDFGPFHVKRPDQP